MSIGGDTTHTQMLDEFFGKLEADSERKVEERDRTRSAQQLPDLSTPEAKEDFLFTEISRLLSRTNQTLSQFEDRIDAGDVYEGTVQGLASTTAEVNKMLDQFVKLKIHREKMEQSDAQLDKKLKHQRLEGDKKLMAKGFEVGSDGRLQAHTSDGGEHAYLLTASPGQITNSPFVQELVKEIKKAAKPQPVDIDIDAVDAEILEDGAVEKNEEK
jgi:hypothetical protein